MAKCTLTFTDKPNGKGFDLRCVFNPPLEMKDWRVSNPTQAQMVGSQLIEALKDNLGGKVKGR